MSFQHSSFSLTTVGSDQPFHFAQNEPEIESGKVMKKAGAFTKGAAVLTFHPKASFLYQGIKCCGGKTKLGDLFGPIVGTILIITSPVALAVKATVGVGSVVGGGIVTGATAVASGVEYAGKRLAGDSDTKKHRKELAEKFVDRMCGIIKCLPDDHQDHFKQNPNSLIGIALLEIAFSSRDQEGDCLKITGGVLKKEQITDQTTDRQRYFDKLCAMKDKIKSLQQMPQTSDDDAWDWLMKAFDKTNDSSQMSAMDDNERSTLRDISTDAYLLSFDVAKEDTFKEAWDARASQL